MAKTEVNVVSRLSAEPPQKPARAKSLQEIIAANRERSLAAAMDVAGPDVPPTDEEILALIVDEMTFERESDALPPVDRTRARGR